MKKYIGIKLVQAEPMTKGAAFSAGLLRMRAALPEAEKEMPGYKVVYDNGYESWSPADVFEAAYRIAETPADRLNIQWYDIDNKAGEIVQFKQSEAYNNLREVDRAGLDARFDAMVSLLGIIGSCATSLETGEGGLCGFNFGVAISLLKRGYVLRRSGWNGTDIVVFKQVPATIKGEIIPKMQSLPDKAKAIILDGTQHIDYTSQCLIYNRKTGRADSWVPSISDTFAEDWELVTE